MGDIIGMRIKRPQRKQELTQAQLALVVSINRSYLAGIERDSHNIGVDVLYRIIEVSRVLQHH